MPTISFSWNMWHRVAYGQFIWINTLKQKQRRRNDEGIPHVCLFVDSYRSNGRRWTSKCSAPSSTLQTTPVTAVTLSRAETSSRSLFHLDPGKTFIYCTLNMLTQTHKLTLCVFQTCVAGEAGVFWERAELHDPTQSASLLVSQHRPEPVHTHRFGMWLCTQTHTCSDRSCLYSRTCPAQIVRLSWNVKI